MKIELETLKKKKKEKEGTIKQLRRELKEGGKEGRGKEGRGGGNTSLLSVAVMRNLEFSSHYEES